MIQERRVICVRLEAKDGTTEQVAATYPTDLTMSNGEIYAGGTFSTMSSQTDGVDMSPASIDFGFVGDMNDITRAEINSGKWDDADVYVFATDWGAPIEDDDRIGRFIMGAIRDVDGRFTGQLMGLKDRLSQNVRRKVSANCAWVFSDAHLDSGAVGSTVSRCGLDAASFTVTGTITGVTDSGVFQDTSRTEADDHFGAGEIIFTSGGNAGLSRRNIDAYDSDGTITLQSPFYYLPEIGDTYTMIAGCRKRGSLDCTTKFSNRNNYGGFSSVPTKSQVTKFGSQ